MSVAMPPPGFDELSVEEKFAYLEALRDRISSADSLPLDAAQKRELDARWAQQERTPEAARPWSEVRAELEAKHSLSE